MFTCQECHRSAIPFFEVFYGCFRCNIKWHPYCVPRSTKNINHPCHPNHPLEVLLQGPPSYSDEKCSLCQRKLSNFVYHCKLCNFSIDMECGNRPPPHKVDHPKCHEHGAALDEHGRHDVMSGADLVEDFVEEARALARWSGRAKRGSAASKAPSGYSGDHHAPAAPQMTACSRCTR